MTSTGKLDTILLSKSQFIRGLQCYKSLYLHRHHPELRDELSQAQEKIFQNGIDVGCYARQLFPDGLEIAFDGMALSEQIRLTREALEDGADTIYEAAFGSDAVFARADILHREKDGWGLYEVKASTRIDDVHIQDVALQHYVLTGAGLSISKASVAHINNKYIRQGAVNIEKLFAIRDVTKKVQELQGHIREKIGTLQEMLTGDMPAVDIGEHCTNPYPCDFQKHCWQHIPEQSVFSLRGRGVNKFGLYRQGIVHLQDVPEALLSWQQRMQQEAALARKEFINRKKVQKFVQSLWYPLCFLDFETCMSAIPPFNGMRPYRHIPFQYSLHIIEREGAQLRHHEFLAEPGRDQREELLKKLLSEIPRNACVLAYNKAFEANILKQLGEWYPSCMKKINFVISNMHDLADPFRRREVYHYLMDGSYSLKAVLPALVPELSYEDMEIGEGMEAMDAFHRIGETDDPEEKARIRAALLEYCRLDTLAMVKIVEKLRSMTAN